MKKPLCMGDVSPTHKIIIERPDISGDDDDEATVEKSRVKLQQTSKKWNVFNFHYYVLLIFDPSLVWQFFTLWFLMRVCIPLNIWIIVCLEIPFSKNLYHFETSQLICKSIDWFLYDVSFYWKVFPNRL